MSISGALLAAGGNTVATYQNINSDAGRLSNSGTVLAYLTQIGGDYATYDPSVPAFDGVVKVLDAANNVIKTVSILADFAPQADYAVNDVAVEALANGGFVMAWSVLDPVGYAMTNTPDFSTHYAVYDNLGDVQASGVLSSTPGYNIKIAALAGGGFATVFTASAALHSQQGIVNTFSYNSGSGTYTKGSETYVGDPNNNAPNGDADTGKLFLFGEQSIVGLSDGGFVVSAPTYDYVSPTYTPLGDFAFKFSASGAQQDFASGAYWQRINWNDGQINNATALAAFDGGYASLDRGKNGQWQVTVFNNDGSLVTTTEKIQQVSNNSVLGPKTYYADDIAPVHLPAGPYEDLLDSSVAFMQVGANLMAVLPNASGGFDYATVSVTTGHLISLVDSGIAVPPGTALANPRFIAEGAGFDITYDVVQVVGDYLKTSTFQYGLTAPPANLAPVVDNIAGDATSYTIGSAEYIDADDFADVHDADSAHFDGGNLLIHQASGAADGSFSFDLDISVSQIRWGTGGVPDLSNDGPNYAAAAALAVGDKVWFSTGLSANPADWILIGTVAADGQSGHDLKIDFSNATAAIPSAAGSESYASLLLKFLKYASPSLGASSFGVSVSDGDGGTSAPVTFSMTGTADQSSTVTASAAVSEPVSLPIIATTAGGAVSVFDFTISDAGSADHLATRVKDITLATAGSGDFAKVTWLLTGPDISGSVTGTYNAVAHTISFANVGVSVADGGNETYTVKAYFNDTSGLVVDSTYQLSIDGDSSLVLENTLSSQMAPGQGAVTNGAGSAVVAGPGVSSVLHATAGADAFNADSLSWTVTFTEAVSNVDAADFDVAGLTGETIGVAAAGGNSYTITVNGGGLASLDGTVTLGLASGQNIVNGASAALVDLAPAGTDERSYLMDNSAPATPGTPNLGAASDNGSSNADDVTNDTTPTFTGSAESGTTVTLYDTDGSTVLGSTTATGSGWSITSSVLDAGVHTVTVKAVDAAGNASAVSSGLAVTIDTGVAAPSLALAADTGTSNSDGITANGVVNVTLAGDVASWEFRTSGSGGWASGSGTSFTLGVGDYAAGDVQVRQVDIAGNASTVASSAAAIKVVGNAAAPSLALAGDTGSSASDGITSNGTVNVTLASDVASWEYRIGGSGGWNSGSGASFTLGAGSYAAGDVEVRQTDAAGNTSAAGSNLAAILVDATAPSLVSIVRANLVWPAGSSGFTVEVQFAASDAALDSATVDTHDITVTGPGLVGALTVSAVSYNAVTHTGTYSIDAPAGGWSAANHAGAYTVALAGNEVRDLAGNAIAADPGAHSFDVSFNTSPVISSNGGLATASIDLAEARTAVGSVAATDIDLGDTLSYSITGGADQGLFLIDSVTGALRFAAAPDSHTPLDIDANNSYVVEVSASDNHGGADVQTITVNVLSDIDRDGTPDVGDTDMDNDGRLNSAEDPVPSAIGSGFGDGNGDGIADHAQMNVASLATAGAAAIGKRFATIEVDDGLALVDVSNSAAPAGLPRNVKMPLGQFDFEIRNVAVGGTVSISMYVDSSLGVNGYYKQDGANWTNIGLTSVAGNKTKVTFSLTDGGAFDADGVANGTIVDPGGAVVIAPRITSNGGEPTASVSVYENGDVVTTIVASALGTPQYSISGGADQGAFKIDPATGVLSFIARPNFEQAHDLGDGAGNNSYVVEVTAAGEGGTDVQQLTVTVLDVNENAPPVDDGDNIPAVVEQQAPALPSANGTQVVAGDGNGDGLADSAQANVTSLQFLQTDTAQTKPGSAAPVYVTLVADSVGGKAVAAGAHAVIREVVQLDAPADLPAGLAMPLGQIGFSATLAQAGATEQFSLYIDGTVPVNGYWKMDSAGSWVNLASAAYGGQVAVEGGKTRLDFSITDGGQFDNDGKADGVITDPGGPGFLAPVSSAPADTDGDQFPDALEAANGLQVGVKDNDIFGSSKLFVMELYRDLLFREAEAPGGAYWQTQIDSGAMNKTQVASAFLDSAEFQDGVGGITRLYMSGLDRLPDHAGLDFFVGNFLAGQKVGSMADGFAASAEFQGKYGTLDNVGFVDQLYHNVLGRAPEKGGVEYWSGQIGAGASRGDVLAGFADSAEYKLATDHQVTVALDFLGLLDRAPSQVEFDYWVGQLDAGVPEAVVIGSVMAGAEYHGRFLP